MRRLVLLAAVVACVASGFVIDVTKAPPAQTAEPTVIDVL